MERLEALARLVHWQQAPPAGAAGGAVRATSASAAVAGPEGLASRATGTGARRPYVLLMTGMNDLQIREQLFDRVWFPTAGPRLHELADLHVVGDATAAAPHIPLAEVIVYWGEETWPYDVLSAHLASATRLQWLHSCSAGVEKLCAVFVAQPRQPGSSASGSKAVVTNAKGVYGVVLAEHALFCCLHFSRRYPYFEANRQARVWQSFTPSSLRGKTLAIVGFGLSGLEIARLGRRGFGMRVEVLRSSLVGELSEEERWELLDRVVERAELKSLLRTADFVVSVRSTLTSLCYATTYSVFATTYSVCDLMALTLSALSRPRDGSRALHRCCPKRPPRYDTLGLLSSAR